MAPESSLDTGKHGRRAASAGHVEVNACDFSGTSMTPLSAFRVRMITLH